MSEPHILLPKTLPLKKALLSSVGKKLLVGVTGLALGFFIITHLMGNLSLYSRTGLNFNLYAEGLEKFGIWLTVAEVGLFATIFGHAILALSLKYKDKQARPTRYHISKTKGGPSKSSIFSRNMVISGSVLLIFLIVHIWQFRFGPGVDHGYMTVSPEGEVLRDLYRLVHETFKNPYWATFYVVAMLFLGAHLRFGYWSLVQTLGINNYRMSNLIHCLAFLLALLLAAGFLFIPIWIYFGANT